MYDFILFVLAFLIPAAIFVSGVLETIESQAIRHEPEDLLSSVRLMIIYLLFLIVIGRVLEWFLYL